MPCAFDSASEGNIKSTSNSTMPGLVIIVAPAKELGIVVMVIARVPVVVRLKVALIVT